MALSRSVSQELDLAFQHSPWPEPSNFRGDHRLVHLPTLGGQGGKVSAWPVWPVGVTAKPKGSLE